MLNLFLWLCLFFMFVCFYLSSQLSCNHVSVHSVFRFSYFLISSGPIGSISFLNIIKLLYLETLPVRSFFQIFENSNGELLKHLCVNRHNVSKELSRVNSILHTFWVLSADKSHILLSSVFFPSYIPVLFYELPCLGQIAWRIFFIVFPVQLEERGSRRKHPVKSAPLHISGSGSAITLWNKCFWQV